MPLCIAGMGRSGTSMIARLLNLCGVELGPTNQMLPPAPDNPEGFWENVSFMRLNQSILQELGGTWDRPPQGLTEGWEDRQNLGQLRRQAEQLLAPFRDTEPWGWKDPRNSLTLPFWRTLLPELKVLICVRNPLAVADSLRVRDGMPLEKSLDLWLSYNRSALAAAPRAIRVVTHYDNYFQNPERELRRVLGLLDVIAPESRVKDACATINPALTHHIFTVGDLLEAGASADVVRCYLDLCEEADLELDTEYRALSRVLAQSPIEFVS
jgi:hypothetical protein